MPSVEVGFVNMAMVFPRHFSNNSIIWSSIDRPLSVNVREALVKAKKISNILIKLLFIRFIFHNYLLLSLFHILFKKDEIYD